MQQETWRPTSLVIFSPSWWFGTWFFFHILGISSSLLTKSIIFQRGRRKTTNQPQKNDLTINDGQPEKYMSLTSMLQSPCWSTHLDDWVHLVRSRELAIGREQEIHHFPPFFTRKKGHCSDVASFFDIFLCSRSCREPVAFMQGTVTPISSFIAAQSTTS